MIPVKSDLSRHSRAHCIKEHNVAPVINRQGHNTVMSNQLTQLGTAAGEPIISHTKLICACKRRIMLSI